MPVTGISDLQMSLIGRRQNASLRGEMVRLAEEIASGQTSDIQKAISGDTAPLTSIDRKLSLLDSYQFAATRADLKFSYAATSLEKLQSDVTALGPELLASLQAGSNTLDPVLSSASEDFQSAVAALQVQAGNQFVFSGLNSGNAPLISANEMLDALRLETTGVSDPSTFLDVIDRWFMEPANGFETNAYRGGPESTVGLAVSSTDTIEDMLTADHDTIRSVLRDLAAVALVSEGSYSGSTSETRVVIQSVGNSLIGVDDQLTSLRATLGEERQNVGQAIAQNEAERYALGQARNDIVGIDVFEAAGRLEEVQTQLESLYLITARTSRLNLTEYLR